MKAGQASVRSARTLFGSRAGSGATVPTVTYALIAVNVAVYILTAVQANGNFVDNYTGSLFQKWEMWPDGVAYNHQWVRLVTSAFLHYGPLHILLNMWALYVVGPGLERAMGWWRYLAVYLLAALGGSVATMLFAAPAGGSVGASGAIFGLFAAAWLLQRVTRMDTRPLTITIVVNFVFTFSIPQISKTGHVGGFVIGGLATVALLGWTTRAMSNSAMRKRTPGVQAASLAGILILLLGLTLFRAHQLATSPIVQGLGTTGAVVHSVDEPGENYSRVITAVEEAVDNRARAGISASERP
ncbi:rhomboid family intramembrane serine protease [Jatrophihabitans telluris]|uniref:Rhomboid family intramembrane serine protease n=1 Tax=Jatrophihabitans telluris TaxID=2038343 RepID=A0ABY4QZP8_9ACTN|nr:rhomboid family intramembrane serine protease [Jatrophihabitans telluris]UQX88572.1 rhomboid family intramembrane serine protease [Jatrophihabitans telluris]